MEFGVSPRGGEGRLVMFFNFSFSFFSFLFFWGERGGREGCRGMDGWMDRGEWEKVRWDGMRLN